MHNKVIDAVLDKRAGILASEEPEVVGLVLSKEQRDIALAVKIVIGQGILGRGSI